MEASQTHTDHELVTMLKWIRSMIVNSPPSWYAKYIYSHSTSRLFMLAKMHRGIYQSHPLPSYLVVLEEIRHPKRPPSLHMHDNIHHNAESQHPRDDAKAEQILWLVVRREEIRAVDLREIPERVDERQRYTAHLGLHVAEGGAGVGQRDGVGGPQAGRHEDEERVARGEVVDDANEDGGYEGEAEPAGDDQAAVVGHTVGEDGGDGCADEGDGVDGDGHVLGLDGGGVAEAVDEGGVEVGEGG